MGLPAGGSSSLHFCFNQTLGWDPHLPLWALRRWCPAPPPRWKVSLTLVIGRGKALPSPSVRIRLLFLPHISACPQSSPHRVQRVKGSGGPQLSCGGDVSWGSLKSLSFRGAQPRPSSHAPPAGAEKENKLGKALINRLPGAVIRSFLLCSGCHAGGPSWQAERTALPSSPHRVRAPSPAARAAQVQKALARRCPLPPPGCTWVG